MAGNWASSRVAPFRPLGEILTRLISPVISRGLLVHCVDSTPGKGGKMLELPNMLDNGMSGYSYDLEHCFTCFQGPGNTKTRQAS